MNSYFNQIFKIIFLLLLINSSNLHAILLFETYGCNGKTHTRIWETWRPL